MFKIMLVSPNKNDLSDLASALIANDDVALWWAESGETALQLVKDEVVDLIIASENLGDMAGLDFVARLVTVNPLINCAVVSQLEPEAFHQAGEGLGVMAQLPANPGKEHAKSLLQQLAYIKNLTSGQKG